MVMALLSHIIVASMVPVRVQRDFLVYVTTYAGSTRDFSMPPRASRSSSARYLGTSSCRIASTLGIGYTDP